MELDLRARYAVCKPYASDTALIMQSTPIMIIGPGAIGCLLAARMARAGLEVRLLDYREDRAARLRQIRLTEEGHTSDMPVRVSADPGIVAECGWLIVCVKAFQTAEVAGRIAPFVKPDASILSLQNGLGNLEALQGIRCRDLRPGVINAGARLAAEGHVHATGGNAIAITGTPEDPVAKAWQRILTQAGFGVQLEPDAQRLLWTKLVLNAAINPVTALYRIPNGDLPHHTEAAALARDLLLESARIARSTGITLDADDILKERLLAICATTRENRSSMLCDVEAGRPTEIDAINGAILRHAHSHDLAAPVNEKLLMTFARG